MMLRSGAIGCKIGGGALTRVLGNVTWEGERRGGWEICVGNVNNGIRSVWEEQ